MIGVRMVMNRDDWQDGQPRDVERGGETGDTPREFCCLLDRVYANYTNIYNIGVGEEDILQVGRRY